MATMTKIEEYLLGMNSKTYSPYYNGKMSYAITGKSWDRHIRENFPDLFSQQTSENIFKTVIDLYVEALMPQQKELTDIVNTFIPLLCRGQAPVIVMADGSTIFPENYEMVSDGTDTYVAVFTRSLFEGKDYVTFIDSRGFTSLWGKDIPDDLSAADKNGYQFIEETRGNNLFRLALDDKGFGSSLAALQDRVNHSIIDQTIVAEMYARPFWYLLNTDLPISNPYLPSQPTPSPLREENKDGAGGRIFVTSSEGPFGQLTPPTINDMITYHESILNKVSYTTGIPQFYFQPGEGTPPTGRALQVMSKRFSNKVARMRDNIETHLTDIATLLQIPKETEQYEFWDTNDDMLQDALDTHGLALTQMGYPLEYTASVVTPGVDLAKYQSDGYEEDVRLGALGV